MVGCDQVRLVRREGVAELLKSCMSFQRVGIESRPAKAEPGRPVASLAPEPRGIRRCVGARASGPRELAPKENHVPRAERVDHLEGSSASDARGETGAQGAGLGIAAREQEDGPETWETSYLHLEEPAGAR